MTRTFSEKSYGYIQGWLKNKYKTDPEFKRKANENTSFCYLRTKVKNMVNLVTVECLVQQYTSPQMTSTPIIINDYM